MAEQKEWVIDIYRNVWVDDEDFQTDFPQGGKPLRLEQRWVHSETPSYSQPGVRQSIGPMTPITLEEAINKLRQVRSDGPLWEHYRIRNVKTDECIPWEALIG